jgi:hypothetical protein
MWAGLAVLLFVAPAAAHTGGTTGFARISVRDQTVSYSLSLGPDVLSARFPGLAGAALDILSELVTARIAITADGQTCVPSLATVTPPTADRGTATVVVHYACAVSPRELAVRDDLFDVLGKDHHTLASFERPGAAAEQVMFEPDRRTARVLLAADASQSAERPARSGGLGFLLLGIEHILTGFDHLLFLLALLVKQQRIWPVVRIVTAFTVAHSVTLSLAALQLVAVSNRIVEPAIAASIVWVALENLLFAGTAWRRILVAFLFGLVHGLGFAGALGELGLSGMALVRALIGFNIGVELGQVACVVVFLPLFAWASRPPAMARLPQIASVLVALMGAFWFVERVLFQ